MEEKINDLIRVLSDEYDPDSKDTYVSMYLNKDKDNRFLEKRIRDCQSALTGEELKNFNETIKDIENTLKNKYSKNIVIFASNKNNFLKYLELPVQLKNQLIVDSSPYIRPLARIIDERESFTLVLISTNYAKIYSISLGHVDETKKLSADIMNKHKKGGWSQARFNRLRKGAIHNFFTEVVGSLEKRADEKIIIAGPGTAKNQFIEMLPKILSDKIVDLIDINVDDENKLLKKSISKILEVEESQSHKAVELLKQEILKDGLAVYGIEETKKAVKNGQVELLIIEKDYKPKGWICEHCQIVGIGSKQKCPYCNNPTSEVDVLEEILEFAKRTDAEIEFTNDEGIRDLGHIGGILRFK